MYPSIQNLLRVLTHYLPPGLVFVLVLFFSGSLIMDHISLKTKQDGSARDLHYLFVIKRPCLLCMSYQVKCSIQNKSQIIDFSCCTFSRSRHPLFTSNFSFISPVLVGNCLSGCKLVGQNHYFAHEDQQESKILWTVLRKIRLPADYFIFSLSYYQTV